MPSIVTINAAQPSLDLEAGTEGSLSFDVANTSGRQISLRARILDDGGGAVPGWLNLSEGSDLSLAPAETRRVSIAVTPPAGSAEARTVRLEIFEVALPEENVDRSAPVSLTVTAAEVAEPEAPKRPGWLIPVIAGAVVLVLAIGGGLAWWLMRDGLPDVEGQSVADAVDMLQDIPVAGITLDVINAPGEPMGTVLTQTPDPGTGDEETLSVTLEVAGVPMPSLMGQDASSAINALLDLDLALAGTRTESSGSIAQLRVIRTDPAAGDLVTLGTPVELVVSSGPPSGNGGLSASDDLVWELDPGVLEMLREQPRLRLEIDPGVTDPPMEFDRRIIDGNQLILNQ